MSDTTTSIVAIVTTKKESLLSGGAPVFITENEEALQEISKNLEKIMDASAHEVNKQTMIIVAR